MPVVELTPRKLKVEKLFEKFANPPQLSEDQKSALLSLWCFCVKKFFTEMLSSAYLMEVEVLDSFPPMNDQKEISKPANFEYSSAQLNKLLVSLTQLPKLEDNTNYHSWIFAKTHTAITYDNTTYSQMRRRKMASTNGFDTMKDDPFGVERRTALQNINRFSRLHPLRSFQLWATIQLGHDARPRFMIKIPKHLFCGKFLERKYADLLGPFIECQLQRWMWNPFEFLGVPQETIDRLLAPAGEIHNARISGRIEQVQATLGEKILERCALQKEQYKLDKEIEKLQAAIQSLRLQFVVPIPIPNGVVGGGLKTETEDDGW